MTVHQLQNQILKRQIHRVQRGVRFARQRVAVLIFQKRDRNNHQSFRG